MILRGSSSTPITPVEAGSTCVTGRRSSLAGSLAGGQRDGIAGAGGAVGVAGIDEDGADQALGRSEVTAAEAHRRGLHAILREDGGRVGGEAGDDQRQIVLLRRANSGVGGGVCDIQAEASKRSFS